MSTRIFVGNLPYSITEDELSSELTRLGHAPTEVVVVKDRGTGLGKGFAFAEYGDPTLATAAIEGLAGARVQGRPLRVDRANPRGTTSRDGSNDRRSPPPEYREHEPRRRDGYESFRAERRAKERRRG